MSFGGGRDEYTLSPFPGRGGAGDTENLRHYKGRFN